MCIEKNAVDPTDPVEKSARELEKKGVDIQSARKEVSGGKEAESGKDRGN
jgi:hypothetical protein